MTAMCSSLAAPVSLTVWPATAKKFAPNAEILHIDIDAAEMDKNIFSNYHLRGDLAEILPC